MPDLDSGTKASAELVELRLESFLDALAAEGAIPAGGAAAAITTALAASLVEMAAVSSPGWQEARAIAAQARALRERVVPLAQADSEAYAEVLATLALQPLGATPERDFALGVALDRAAELPLRIAEAAADVTELAAYAAFSCDVKVRGEVLTAAVLSEAAVRAAAGLVRINLATAEGDERMEQGQTAASAAAAALRQIERAI